MEMPCLTSEEWEAVKPCSEERGHVTAGKRIDYYRYLRVNFVSLLGLSVDTSIPLNIFSAQQTTTICDTGLKKRWIHGVKNAL